MAEEKETYFVDVKCANCGYEGSTEIEKGKPVTEAECPQCGVKSLVPKGVLTEEGEIK